MFPAMAKNTKEKPIDIPLSCSSFLESALNSFNYFSTKTPNETKDFVHDWNMALVDTINHNQSVLGEFGQHIMNVANVYPHIWQTYINSCLVKSYGGDMHCWALLYAIRFTGSIEFLKQKLKNSNNIKFVDYGCGLSPVAVLARNKMGIQDTYCVEIYPQIIDIYIKTAARMGVKEPDFITWEDMITLSGQAKLNTVVSTGVFPYITKSKQTEYFSFINQNIANFFIEIKYYPKSVECLCDGFNLSDLRQIYGSVKNSDHLLKNHIKFLNIFRRVLPNERNFIENSRSLFLTR